MGFYGYCGCVVHSFGVITNQRRVFLGGPQRGKYWEQTCEYPVKVVEGWGRVWHKNYVVGALNFGDGLHAIKSIPCEPD